MKSVKELLTKLSKRLPSENRLPFLTLAFTLSALVLTVVAVGQQQNLIQNAAEREICPTEGADTNPDNDSGDNPDGDTDENPDEDSGDRPDRQATRAAREATRAARQGDGAEPDDDGTETSSQSLLSQGYSQSTTGIVALSVTEKEQLRTGIKGQLIVKYKPGKSKRTAEEKLARRNARIKKRNARLNADVVQLPVNQETAAIAELRNDPDVLYVERDYPVFAVFTPNDKHYAQQYALNNTGQKIGQDQEGGKEDIDIDAPEAWDTTQGGVKVAVIDSGVDSAHPDLKGQIAADKDFSGSGTTDDAFGHGTFVAGIIAAKTNNNEGIAGVCPKCTILNARILDDNGKFASQEPLVEAIHWAVDQGAKVINLSVASQGKTQILEDAINYAWDHGVIVVAGAGNCGGDNFSQNGCQTKNPIMYPAAFDNAIAVGAVDNKGNRASFSESGDWVDVTAPGVDIASTSPSKKYKLGGGNGALNYTYFSGTSFATPQVAGIAALAMSEGNASNSEVRNKIESTAENLQGSGTKHGLVKASKVLGGGSGDPDEPTKKPKPCKSPKPTKDKNKPDKSPKPSKSKDKDKDKNKNDDLICRLAPNLSQCKKKNNGCDDVAHKRNEEKAAEKDKDKDKKKKDSDAVSAQNTETVITITEDGGNKNEDQSGGDGNKKEPSSPGGSGKEPCEKNKEKDNKKGGNSLLCRLAPFLGSCKDGGNKNNNKNDGKNDNKNGGNNKCKKNNDCKNDEICKGGKCEKKNDNKCKNNNDCAGDKICRQGKCEKKEVKGASTQRELDPESAMNILEYNILYACMAKEKSCTPELMRASDRNNDGVVNRLDYDTLVGDMKRE